MEQRIITTATRTRLLALLAVGICDALREETIDVLEAERLLFSPRAMELSSSCGDRIVELIHMGTELDDIKSLVPDDYESTLERIRTLAMECLVDQKDSADPQEGNWTYSIF
ncbi:DUF3969 family protein, partial [Rubinisphaera sp. JC750]|uniref:DUF3969 family protein n=1 Tax=Rubinisphaera sp. JC750 TaxID=2898658 RepID=UPI001F3EA7EB